MYPGSGRAGGGQSTYFNPNPTLHCSKSGLLKEGHIHVEMS